MKLIDILNIISTLQKKNLKELTMVELGEQELKLWNKDLTNNYIKKWYHTNPRIWPIKPPSSRYGFFSKDFFNYYFKECTSVDFDCHCDKTVKVNLELDIFKQNINKQYDVLTNIGTTEHVGQKFTTTPGSKINEIITETKNPQYHTFKNVHDLVKKGGYFFHNIPYAKDINNLNAHGAYCYNEKFIKQLAEKNNYTVLKNELYMGPERSNFMDAILIKNDNNDFMSEDEFVNMDGLFETHMKR